MQKQEVVYMVQVVVKRYKDTTGTVINLYSDTEIQAINQEDLTGLEVFSITINGHKALYSVSR